MNIRQTALVLVLLLVAGAAVILNQEEFIPGESASTGDRKNAFAENITLSVMDEKGQPVYRVTSSNMSHLDDSDLVILTRPMVMIIRPDGSEWLIEAERGEAAANGDRVWLPGNVSLKRERTSPRGSLKISASDVLVMPGERRLETTRKAVITSENYRVETIGLEADLNNNRLELKSRVRGKINGAG